LLYSHIDFNGTTTTQKLQRGDVGLLKSFIHYVYHRDSIGNPIAANYHQNPISASNDTQVWMPKERWLSLDDKTKSIWDSIDDIYKNFILGYTSSSPSFPTRSGKPPPKTPTKPPMSHTKHFYMISYKHSVTVMLRPKKIQLAKS
jgi:hypothetical protein